ncbi:MAG TPA: tripartite tricarboxylate transporter substrate binding protein [Burkholderiales bacterium]|nr:tripartite tricarboxylate transporter substrate binding protein [Burkholderiales bacterium]
MFASRILIAVLLSTSCNSLLAQPYPSRAARMVVPWTAGGTADLMARIASMKFSEAFGQQFIVDNRPGAGGLIGTDQVAKAAPDGHTLLLATTAPNSVAPSLYAKIPFDPVKDFASISLMATTCYVLSVNPSMPVKNTRELVALAKARPGQLTFSSPGAGTPNHLSGELFKMLTGIDMQHVPYKGSAQAIGDVIGGQIAMSFENIVVASPFVKSGRIKPLAVTSIKRSNALPAVPTISESGVPGFEAVGWFGIVAPAATPKEIVAKLNSEMMRMLATPDVKERISNLGAEVVPTTPEGMDKFNRAQISLWAKVVKASGARAE